MVANFRPDRPNGGLRARLWGPPRGRGANDCASGGEVGARAVLDPVRDGAGNRALRVERALAGDAAHIAAAGRTVVIADACFTAPAVVVQFPSGRWLTRFLGLPLDSSWIRVALWRFVLVGCCWLPVLWLQVRARNLAREAVAQGTPLPRADYTVMRWWFVLGWPAFTGVMAIFWLMVAKPAELSRQQGRWRGKATGSACSRPPRGPGG